jgi:rhamnogalacturonyl hydrolase YesR
MLMHSTLPASLLAFILPSHALANTTHNATLPLSLQMARSIMSRNQGILASSTDSSALLQAGFTQKVLHQLLGTYPNSSLTTAIKAYITTSVESVVPVVSNGKRDIGYPLDRLSSGDGLLRRWEESGEKKYREAVEALRRSIDLQPRNEQGGLWYYTYPHWSYLDGMYSFAPFMPAYTTAHFLNNTRVMDREVEDVVLQLDLLWRHCYYGGDGEGRGRGLLVHGYDASRTAVWANNITGASPHVWGRSLGWYCMALLDTLELLSTSYLDKSTAAVQAKRYIEARVRELMPAIAAAVDPSTGAWHQILDQPEREGNYIESSGSAMLVYSLLKGVRLGFLPTHPQPYYHLPLNRGASYQNGNTSYIDLALRAYAYLANTFIVDERNGTLGWNGTVGVCSLNSSASYEVSEVYRIGGGEEKWREG